MINMKALAAIALTMIICVPIGAGYLLSMDEVETTGWQSTGTYNISDELINNTTNYYMAFNGTANNSELVKQNTTTAVLPSYVKTSSQVTAYPVSSGVYGDVSQGWKLPSEDNYYWYNGMENYAVTLLVKLPVYSAATQVSLTLTTNVVFGTNSDFWMLTIYNEEGADSLKATLLQILPSVSEETYDLGSYEYLAIEYTMDGVTVNGLSAWPSFGASYTTINSVSFSHVMHSTFDQIELTETGASTYRVDGATILAGTYPSTVDYTLDMDSLYPGASWGVKLNSVGVYGDSITIAGTTYAVKDGKITVDGKAVSLRGLSISATELSSSAGSYEVKINDTTVATVSESPTIAFNGEWSLTATANTLEEKTETSTQWVAGGFGLDKSGMVAVGLMAAAACFVVLGMMGRMSGSKVGFLALVCGVSALTLLIII